MNQKYSYTVFVYTVSKSMVKRFRVFRDNAEVVYIKMAQYYNSEP